MKIRLLVVLLCAYCVRTLQVPSWQPVKDQLHAKIRDIYQREIQRDVESGKFFKYIIPDDQNEYEVFEHETKKLPHWLTFDPTKNKLMGVPTTEDLKSSLKLQLRKKNENSKEGFDDDSTYLVLNRKSHKQPFNCKRDATTIGSVIFHTDIKRFDATDRVKFLRNFASFMDLHINDLHLAAGNRMENNDYTEMNSLIRKAGPGDKKLPLGEQPGVTVSWKVKCGSDIVGDLTISKLVTQQEDFKSVLLEPVLGWFVTTNKLERKRRAAGLNGTPVVGAGTPGVGTPTLAPSATVAIVSTSMIKPTPSKSIMMSMTSIPTTMPPTTTTTTTSTESTSTTEKVTTEEITTTTKAPTPTEEVVTTKDTTVTVTPSNRAPILQNGFGTIKVYQGQALQKKLPVNMFYDPDKSDMLDITFKYFPVNSNQPVIVPANHWVAYRNKKLFMLPVKGVPKKQKFILTATDPSGLYVNDVFFIEVQDDPNILYNILFNVTLDLDFSEYNNSVEKRVTLVQKLAQSMSRDNYDYDYKMLRSLHFVQGSVIVKFGVDDKELSSCNNVEVQRFVEVLKSAEFKNAMGTILVTNVGMTETKECVLPPQPREDDDDGLWTRILIPVIVIVIILLIIALILCCVYRRKQKYDPQTDDTELLKGSKKPVILLEEYEEKQDFVSLKPLILPNEKPPVQAYEPRADTPDGPSSSTTGSTENEEKGLLGSPKDSPRKGFNAPPPYSAR